MGFRWVPVRHLGDKEHQDQRHHGNPRRQDRSLRMGNRQYTGQNRYNRHGLHHIHRLGNEHHWQRRCQYMAYTRQGRMDISDPNAWERHGTLWICYSQWHERYRAAAWRVDGGKWSGIYYSRRDDERGLYREYLHARTVGKDGERRGGVPAIHWQSVWSLYE